MDALDAHPGKGREEEIVQQPCNNGAEKLPRNKQKEREGERKFMMREKTVILLLHVRIVICTLFVSLLRVIYNHLAFSCQRSL